MGVLGFGNGSRRFRPARFFCVRAELNLTGKAPSIPWYPDKWLVDTKRLSDPAKGIYIDLLMVIWMQFQDEQCSIPDNDEFIAGEIGRSVEAWKSARVEIMNPFRPLLIVRDGRLFNNGLTKSLLKRDAFRSKQSENGALGGRPKGSKKKDKKPKPFFDESQTKAKKSLPIPIPFSITENNTTPVLDTSIVVPPSAQHAQKPEGETVRGILEEFKRDLPYINVDVEIGKIKLWKSKPKNLKRQITRRFLIDWVGRIDVPVNMKGESDATGKINPTLNALERWKAKQARNNPDNAEPSGEPVAVADAKKV